MSEELKYYLSQIEKLTIKIEQIKNKEDYNTNIYWQNLQKKLWITRNKFKYRIQKMIDIAKHNS